MSDSLRGSADLDTKQSHRPREWVLLNRLKHPRRADMANAIHGAEAGVGYPATFSGALFGPLTGHAALRQYAFTRVVSIFHRRPRERSILCVLFEGGIWALHTTSVCLCFALNGSICAAILAIVLYLVAQCDAGVRNFLSKLGTCVVLLARTFPSPRVHCFRVPARRPPDLSHIVSSVASPGAACRQRPMRYRWCRLQPESLLGGSSPPKWHPRPRARHRDRGALAPCVPVAQWVSLSTPV